MALILYVSVDLSELVRLKQDYRWPRPKRCLQCRACGVWGHGYVGRCFDGVVETLAVKRWRCPNCRAVYTMRPCSHWRGFLAETQIIRTSLEEKHNHDRWTSAVSRQRQQYWWRGLRRQQVLEGELRDLSGLFDRPLILATHSLIYREIRSYTDPPYRIFAFSPSSRAP